MNFVRRLSIVFTVVVLSQISVKCAWAGQELKPKAETLELINQILGFASGNPNQALASGNGKLLAQIEAKGERNSVIGFILDRSAERKLGVNLFYANRSLFVSWLVPKDEGTLNLEMQLSFGEELRVDRVDIAARAVEPVATSPTVPAEASTFEPPVGHPKEPRR